MAQRIIYPINEQEVNDGTSEDVPEHETQASPEQVYQDRLPSYRRKSSVNYAGHPLMHQII